MMLLDALNEVCKHGTNDYQYFFQKILDPVSVFYSSSNFQLKHGISFVLIKFICMHKIGEVAFKVHTSRW